MCLHLRVNIHSETRTQYRSPFSTASHHQFLFKKLVT
ncbi:unnamed protein product [Schistosoma curassoni]|uniref:Uncharacterized protein n=1 Tax=Schistosoma curassoni TaxID=6186 RepID=A0A183JZ15_9TREM|nr:unnamed protein product [Schistosoma curassoni]